MSITDLKRHSESKTPTISRLVSSPSQLAVKERSPPQPDTDAHATRPSRFADGVHPNPGTKTDGPIGQPGFHAGRKMTLVAHGRWRPRQVRINGARNLGAAWQTGSDGGPGPHLTRQFEPRGAFPELRRSEGLDCQSKPHPGESR